jgi:tRNA A37 threonylcarbamoyladenosine dehydratase
MERFTRVDRLIGTENLNKLQNSHITIVGLGAVGSHVAEALCRAGIGNLKLVDFDKIEISNLNRHIHATESTLGLLKTEVVKSKLLDINPNCNIETLEVFVHTDTMNSIIGGTTDILVDAIDALNPKVELLAACNDRKIEVISSMGAALQRDPFKIKVADIKKTKKCGLARSVRKKLKKREIYEGITCVFSMEDINFEYIEPTEKYYDDKNDIRRGRVRRTLGSLPIIPGIFGLIVANLVIEKIIE